MFLAIVVVGYMGMDSEVSTTTWRAITRVRVAVARARVNGDKVLLDRVPYRVCGMRIGNKRWPSCRYFVGRIVQSAAFECLLFLAMAFSMGLLAYETYPPVVGATRIALDQLNLVCRPVHLPITSSPMPLARRRVKCSRLAAASCVPPPLYFPSSVWL
jgi:hypothetical protein